MFKALHGGQNGWEASERQCGAGGGCSYKTLWVVLRTLDFIFSWIDAECFKWWRFQIRTTFSKHFPDWVCPGYRRPRPERDTSD